MRGEGVPNHDRATGRDPQRCPLEPDFDTLRYERFAAVGTKAMERDRDVAAVDELVVDTKIIGCGTAASRNAEDQ